MLEGEQCLAFFLGGIPSQTSSGFVMTGFSRNGNNPGGLGGADREPPFFEFKSNRLVQWIPQPPYVPPNTIGTAPGYPSYLDGYGKTPYAYFSSYKTANGYNRYANYMNPYLNLNTPPSGCQPVASDCQALPFTQWQTNALGQIVPVQGVGVWPEPLDCPNYFRGQGPKLRTGHGSMYLPGRSLVGWPVLDAANCDQHLSIGPIGRL
jgi:hypothetical protein